jgi:hypothetical protein
MKDYVTVVGTAASLGIEGSVSRRRTGYFLSSEGTDPVYLGRTREGAILTLQEMAKAKEAE